MINYFKYLLSNPGKLVYCLTVLLFCIACFLIILTNIHDTWELVFAIALVTVIFVVAQLQPILEYIDRR
jgi:hypothetical protein